jgi:hypothetical protein
VCHIHLKSSVCGSHDWDETLHGESSLQTPQESPARAQLQPFFPVISRKQSHQPILWLMNCFVFFYCSNNIMNFYGFYTVEKIPRLDEINGILSLCYPNFFFLLMKNNKFISQFISMMRICCSQRTFGG